MAKKELNSTLRDCEHILARSRIARLPKTYALGIYGQRVTFLSQQRRALNLVWALFNSDQIRPGQKVAVIGGGLGGMTAAVGAYAVGCRVSLFEQSERLMNLQRGCYHRYIHPTIHTWPAKEAGEDETKLPCLNWSAGPAYQVVATVEREFERIAAGGINVFTGTQIEKIDSAKGRPRITTSH